MSPVGPVPASLHNSSMARKPSGSSGGTASKRGRPSSDSGGGSSSTREEIQVAKSPAEFFAENQSIAGFDNMGKSLYTTIRELVENSLDACESVNVLPDISVRIEELNQRQFNIERGVSTGGLGTAAGDDEDDNDEEGGGKKSPTPSSGAESSGAKKTKAKSGGRGSSEGYFHITVRDNGCGMAHEAIPNLLGRVLSGSKYGVRQTRGKFGLGAKMALIWSKKSTGVPIRVTTSHVKGNQTHGTHVSRCVLDIDIYKNRPRVIEHTKRPNKDNWIGTEFEVMIGGNWTTYKARIVQYLQQLAIITPYASLELHYANLADRKKDMAIRYGRRSEQMPAPAKEVKHHPSSVNNLLVQQLLEQSKAKTFLKFLCNDLSAVSPTVAKRLIAQLEDDGFDEDMPPPSVTDKQITRLVQLLRTSEAFKAPDGSCLSPLGEYNLNLGIHKVVEPDVIATARDKAGAYEGHPFIVEAAVSLGGKGAKEGISVMRFANRIPLLFEGGADVATRVAQTKIKWSSYKIDHKRDKVGVFVSIVSTKVPFKGTGKEYIGDDITEIQLSVKRALQQCCQQLRLHLTKRNAIRDQRERKSRLAKYVPDISRSLYGILDGMRKRKLDDAEGIGRASSPRKLVRTGDGGSSPGKRAGTMQDPDLDSNGPAMEEILTKLEREEITAETIGEHLIEAVDAQCSADDGGPAESSAHGENGSGGKGGAGGRKGGGKLGEVSQPLFIVPVFSLPDDVDDVHHPLFTFRPINPLPLWPVEVE